MASAWAVFLALAPSVGVGFLFYKVIKAIIEGDRNERLAHSRWEAEQDRRRAAAELEKATQETVPPEDEMRRDAPDPRA